MQDLIHEYLPLLMVGFFVFCLYKGITGNGGKNGGSGSNSGGGQ